MKKTKLFLLLFFLSHCYTYAQNVTEVELILSTNSLYTIQDYINPLKISNTNSVTTSGEYSSEDYIRIVPIADTSILIIPTYTYLNNFSGQSSPLPGIATAIRIKPPGTRDPQVPTINIYPNPVQTNLNFTIKNGLVSSYTIYDISGTRMLFQSITPNNTGVINVPNLTNGIYILKLDITNGQPISIQFNKI